MVVDRIRTAARYAAVAPHAVHGLLRAGLLTPVRPDRALGMLAGVSRSGLTAAASTALGAARHPHRPAVVDDDGMMTFAELDAAVTAVAGALSLRHGVGPGSTVGVLCRNHRWFVLAVLATSRLGADLVLLNTDSAAPQLATVLRRERVGVLVADEEFGERVDGAGHGDPVVWSGPARRPRDGGPRDSGSPGDSLRGMAASGTPAPPRAPRQGKVVIMTSGTTGAPKGAPRQPDPMALLGPMASMLTRVPVRTGEPMLVAPPAFHALGFAYLLIGLFLGSPVVLQRASDPAETLDALRRHRVGCLVVVPVMLSRLLDVPHPPPLPALRAVVSSGSALSPSLAAAFMDVYGDVLHNLYGSSEIAVASLATPAELRSAPGTVGRPPHGTTVRILGEDGRQLPTGQVGRIFVGSPLAFDGYTGGGGRQTVGGLIATGDLGHFDGSGLLFVDGRDDDMIISGGENVFPQEVEECIAGHPAVADAAVVGVPDDTFGQRLAAYVVLRDGSTVTADQLRDHVRANLARFKVPRDVEFVAAIPRNATGKVLRTQLGRR